MEVSVQLHSSSALPLALCIVGKKKKSQMNEGYKLRGILSLIRRKSLISIGE